MSSTADVLCAGCDRPTPYEVTATKEEGGSFGEHLDTPIGYCYRRTHWDHDCVRESRRRVDGWPIKLGQTDQERKQRQLGARVTEKTATVSGLSHRMGSIHTNDEEDRLSTATQTADVAVADHQEPRKPRLFTWSWKKALAYDGDDVVLVRISLGQPKKLVPAAVAAAFPYIEELAPAGCFHLRHVQAFRECYFRRLNQIGVDTIEERFAELLAASEGRPLVLLCYEAHPSQCHRGDFAQWWQDKTGEEIREFDAPADQPAAEEAADPLF